MAYRQASCRDSGTQAEPRTRAMARPGLARAGPVKAVDCGGSPARLVDSASRITVHKGVVTDKAVADMCGAW